MPLRVSFPPRALNPNKRSKRWGNVNARRPARVYKEEVYWATVEAVSKGWVTVPETDRIGVHLIFTPPTERGPIWDDDNMEAAFKAGRDGLAMALKRDDRCFKVTREVRSRDAQFKLGKVVIELRPLTDG